MKVSDKAKDYIVEKGWDEQFGARPLKRAIQKYIEDPLAEEIIKSTTYTKVIPLLLISMRKKMKLKLLITKAKKPAVKKK